MSKDELSNCPDCGVQPGQEHVPGCDVERCSVCSNQRLSCECNLNQHNPSAVKWTGQWPSKVTTGEDREIKELPISVWIRRHSMVESILCCEMESDKCPQGTEYVKKHVLPDVMLANAAYHVMDNRFLFTQIYNGAWWFQVFNGDPDDDDSCQMIDEFGAEDGAFYGFHDLHKWKVVNGDKIVRTER